MTTTDPAQRAQANADKARQRFDTTHIAKEWWQITRPGGQVMDVFMCPPATQKEMIARYPGCGVLPL